MVTKLGVEQLGTNVGLGGERVDGDDGHDGAGVGLGRRVLAGVVGENQDAAGRGEVGALQRSLLQVVALYVVEPLQPRVASDGLHLCRFGARDQDDVLGLERRINGQHILDERAQTRLPAANHEMVGQPARSVVHAPALPQISIHQDRCYATGKQCREHDARKRQCDADNPADLGFRHPVAVADRGQRHEGPPQGLLVGGELLVDASLDQPCDPGTEQRDHHDCRRDAEDSRSKD